MACAISKWKFFCKQQHGILRLLKRQSYCAADFLPNSKVWYWLVAGWVFKIQDCANLSLCQGLCLTNLYNRYEISPLPPFPFLQCIIRITEYKGMPPLKTVSPYPVAGLCLRAGPPPAGADWALKFLQPLVAGFAIKTGDGDIVIMRVDLERKNPSAINSPDQSRAYHWWCKYCGR